MVGSIVKICAGFNNAWQTQTINIKFCEIPICWYRLFNLNTTFAYYIKRRLITQYRRINVRFFKEVS